MQPGQLTLEVSENVFLGGISDDVALPTSFQDLGFARTFEGCIANATVDSVPLIPDGAGAVTERRGIVGCNSVALTLPGANLVFFGALPLSASAGPEQLRFSFYTRRSDGVLLHAPGRLGTGDFLFVGLSAGSLVLQQNFGQETLAVSLPPGRWARQTGAARGAGSAPSALPFPLLYSHAPRASAFLAALGAGGTFLDRWVTVLIRRSGPVSAMEVDGVVVSTPRSPFTVRKAAAARAACAPHFPAEAGDAGDPSA